MAVIRNVIIKRVYLLNGQGMTCQAFLFLSHGNCRVFIRTKMAGVPHRNYELPPMGEEEATAILERDLRAMARELGTALITIDVPKGWTPEELMDWLNNALGFVQEAWAVFH